MLRSIQSKDNRPHLWPFIVGVSILTRFPWKGQVEILFFPLSWSRGIDFTLQTYIILIAGAVNICCYYLKIVWYCVVIQNSSRAAGRATNINCFSFNKQRRNWFPSNIQNKEKSYFHGKVQSFFENFIFPLENIFHLTGLGLEVWVWNRKFIMVLFMKNCKTYS